MKICWLGGSRGVSAVAAVVGFHVCWLHPTGSCFGGLVERGDGLVGTLAAKPAPLEVFSPDPEASNATQALLQIGLVGSAFAASTGAFGGSGGPPGSQLAEL